MMKLVISGNLTLLIVTSICIFGFSCFLVLRLKKQEQHILETERLVLREFTMQDEKDLLPLFSDPDVMHFSVWGPLDNKGVKNFLEKTLQSYKTYGYGKWAVILKETGELIGACGIHNVQVDGELLTEVGYRLAKKYWGKGLGTEVARAIRDYGFKVLNLPYLVSCMHPDNVASIRVAEKNGMKYCKNGEFFGTPCQIYEITQDEWVKLKNPA